MITPIVKSDLHSSTSIVKSDLHFFTAIVTSDLHYGITSPVRISSLVSEMMTHNPDIIIIAGDTGEPWQEFDKCLSLFSNVKCPVGVILGNHDLYATAGAHSEELWSTILPGIVERHGYVWMESENIIIDRTAFVGTIAWYDYSSKHPTLSHLSDDCLYSSKSRVMADGSYIDWARKDTEFAAEIKEGFLKRLKAAHDNPDVNRIIVVTHVPLYREQMLTVPGEERSSAYFGNLTLGQEIRKYHKVTHVISGHTHRPVDTMVGSIRVQIVPGDYRKPGYLILTW